MMPWLSPMNASPYAQGGGPGYYPSSGGNAVGRHGHPSGGYGSRPGRPFSPVEPDTDDIEVGSPAASASPSPPASPKELPPLSLSTNLDFFPMGNPSPTHNFGFPAFTYGPNGEIMGWYDGAMASTKALWSTTPVSAQDTGTSAGAGASAVPASAPMTGPADFLAGWTTVTE